MKKEKTLTLRYSKQNRGLRERKGCRLVLMPNIKVNPFAIYDYSYKLIKSFPDEDSAYVYIQVYMKDVKVKTIKEVAVERFREDILQIYGEYLRGAYIGVCLDSAQQEYNNLKFKYVEAIELGIPYTLHALGVRLDEDDRLYNDTRSPYYRGVKNDNRKNLVVRYNVDANLKYVLTDKGYIIGVFDTSTDAEDFIIENYGELWVKPLKSLDKTIKEDTHINTKNTTVTLKNALNIAAQVFSELDANVGLNRLTLSVKHLGVKNSSFILKVEPYEIADYIITVIESEDNIKELSQTLKFAINTLRHAEFYSEEYAVVSVPYLGNNETSIDYVIMHILERTLLEVLNGTK